MSEQVTKKDIEEVFENHWSRKEGTDEPSSNHFVEILFSYDGETGENIQFQWGMMNAANLDQEMKESWRGIIESEGLTVQSEDSNYITTVDQDLRNARRLTDLTERMLNEIYGCDLTDVVTVRERDL